MDEYVYACLWNFLQVKVFLFQNTKDKYIFNSRDQIGAYCYTVHLQFSVEKLSPVLSLQLRNKQGNSPFPFAFTRLEYTGRYAAHVTQRVRILQDWWLMNVGLTSTASLQQRQASLQNLFSSFCNLFWNSHSPTCLEMH